MVGLMTRRYRVDRQRRMSRSSILITVAIAVKATAGIALPSWSRFGNVICVSDERPSRRSNGRDIAADLRRGVRGAVCE